MKKELRSPSSAAEGVRTNATTQSDVVEEPESNPQALEADGEEGDAREDNGCDECDYHLAQHLVNQVRDDLVQAIADFPGHPKRKVKLSAHAAMRSWSWPQVPRPWPHKLMHSLRQYFKINKQPYIKINKINERQS